MQRHQNRTDKKFRKQSGNQNNRGGRKNHHGKKKNFQNRPPNHLPASEWRYILEFDEFDGGEPEVYPQFKRITVHKKPHADEILAVMMVASPEGRKVFPNLFPDGKIDFDKVEFVATNGLPNDRSYKQRPATLHIGCGGDPRFDEHGRDDADYKSACSLMANALGLRSDPRWAHLVECVRREDREGRAQLGEVVFILKKLYQAVGDDEMEAINWAIIAFDAVVKHAEMEWNAICGRKNDRSKQLHTYAGELEKRRPATTRMVRDHLEAQGRTNDLGRFEVLANLARHYEQELREQARKCFLSEAKCYAVRAHWGQTFRLFTVVTDNPEMGTVCWKDFHADILVIRSANRNGQTAILTSTRAGIRLHAIHKEILQQEKNKDAEWVLPPHAEKLLNGSLSFVDVPPTGLSPHEIAMIFQRTFGKNRKRKETERRQKVQHKQPMQKPIVSVGLAFEEFESEYAKLQS